MRLSSLALLALGPALALASNVIDLDTKNFDSFVGGAKGALVEFYAPWSARLALRPSQSPATGRCRCPALEDPTLTRLFYFA